MTTPIRGSHLGRLLAALTAVAVAGAVLTGCQPTPGPVPSGTASETAGGPAVTPTEASPGMPEVPGSAEVALTVTGQAFSGTGEKLSAQLVLYTPAYWDSGNGSAILAYIASTGPVPSWASAGNLAANNAMLGVVDISTTLEGEAWPFPGEIGIAIGPGDAELFRSDDSGINAPDEGWPTIDGASSTRAVVAFLMPEAAPEHLTASAWAQFFEYWGMLDLSGSDEWDFNPDECRYEPSAGTAGIPAVQSWYFFNDGASCYAGIGD